MEPKTEKQVSIQYKSIIDLRIILTVAFCSVMLVLGLFYFHPSNLDWYKHPDFDLYNLLQFVIVDQITIEISTATILTLAIIAYGKIFGIRQITLHYPGFFSFILKFLPVYFLVYFISGPVSTTLRYLYHSLVLQRESLSYWDSYFFFSRDLYLIYLFPIAIMCTLLLGVLFLRSVRAAQERAVERQPAGFVALKVNSNTGEKIIPSDSIHWVQKRNRKYFVKSDDGLFEISKNLKSLVHILPDHFVLINRSTIINLASFKEYAFWENEKYILRTIDGQEFNITRARLKELKQKLMG